jgi:hypothetical protein
VTAAERPDEAAYETSELCPRISLNLVQLGAAAHLDVLPTARREDAREHQVDVAELDDEGVGAVLAEAAPVPAGAPAGVGPAHRRPSQYATAVSAATVASTPSPAAMPTSLPRTARAVRTKASRRLRVAVVT